MRQVWVWVVSGTIIVVMVTALVLTAPLPYGDASDPTRTPALSGEFMPNPAATFSPTSTVTAAAPVTATRPLPAVLSSTATPAPQATATGQDVASVEDSDGGVAVEDPDLGYVPEEVVIKLVPGSDLTAIAADFQLNPTPIDQFGSREIYRMRILDGSSPIDRAPVLQSDPRIEFAEPNFTIRPPEWRSRYSWARFDEPGDATAQWAGTAMRLAEAHQVSTGAGVIVAVLDTGVDATHPDLAGRVVAGYDFVDLDDDPGEVGGYTDATPAYGHGTHVAGTIALTAPGASIMPIRVLDPEGNGNIWVLAEALFHAVDPDGNPDTDDGADIINLSLGTLRRTDLLDEIVRDVVCYSVDDDDDDVEPIPPPPSLPIPTHVPIPPAVPDDDDFDDDVDDDFDDDDFDDDDDDSGSRNAGTTLRVSTSGHGTDTMTRASGSQAFQVSGETPSCAGGAVVVAAAGNSGTDTPEYPAAEDQSGVLSVGASDQNGQLAETSNFGGWVDVTAPGVDIVSAMPEGQYASWSGTSMASAFAAGQLALMRSVYPDLDAEELINRVVSTSAAIPGPVPWRIDAAASVTAPR